ncbi:MAG: DUF262 domain-containing protein [Eubacteriales bacterium]|nr:DUF262 domain-containing protein [Eubacteriales bacterium]
MADNYKINQFSVANILNLVESSQIAIPEIQRPFVWKGKEVCALIDSLYEGYPIGYLIVWQNSQVRIRGFGKGGTKKILIDGQQRITALMAALLGKEVLNDSYQSQHINIAFNPIVSDGEEHFAVSDEKYVEDPEWIEDISVLFRRDFSYRKFEKEYKDRNPGKDLSNLEKNIDRLKGILKHQVGIIELSFLLDIDVVSEIFIRINLQGKPLNQEDFVMSKISVNEQYDGDRIRNCIDYFCHLLQEPSFLNIIQQNEADFMATEYGQKLKWAGSITKPMYVPTYADMLKVVMIVCFGKTKVGDLVHLLSGKLSSRGEVSKKLSKESFEKLGMGVKEFVAEENFQGFLNALKTYGYGCDRLLYSQAVLNYCYAMYLKMGLEGIKGEERDRLMARWMTMALITGHYQSSPDSTVTKDCTVIDEEGFRSYLKQIEELKLTDEFFESILSEKYSTTTLRTAPFLAYMAAQCAGGEKSLYSDTPIGELYEAKAESYQILPKAYLEKCGFKTRETYGQAANITFISKDVKSIVKKKSPADYADALKAKVEEDMIANTLRANAIPENIFEITEKDVETFLLERRKLMAAKVKDYYFGL